MNQFQTKYTENDITYWPSYEAGKIGIIFLGLLETIFIAISLCTFSDNITMGTRLEIIVAIPVVVIVGWLLLRYIFRAMYIKIVISNKGIENFNNYTKSEKYISWEDVSAVYFYQEHWYGRKSCRIHLKQATTHMPRGNELCDLVLPIFSVDEQKLLHFIPVDLWKNNPWCSL